MLDILKKYYKEFLIFCTIFLDILGFIGILAPELEILDKILSWFVFAVLFYQLSITNLFFEIKHKSIDLFILFAFYLLIVKNFLFLMVSKMEEFSHGGVLYSISSFFADNQPLIITISFYMGTLLIILISYYTAKNVLYTKKSLFAVLLNDTNEQEGEFIGSQEDAPSFFAKFFMSFMLYNSFFVIIFNILQEWLGYIDDDMITIISIVVVLVIYKKHKEKKINIKIIDDISEISEGFYRNVISSIDKLRYLKLLASAILSLQILTDFFIFVSPIFLGRSEVYYLSKLQGHETIFNFFLSDLAKTPALLAKGELLIAYLMAGTFIVLIMAMPSFIWYLTYTEKKESIPTSIIVLFFVSMTFFAFSPIMRFVPIDNNSESTYNLFGVDILMSPISEVTKTNYQLILFYSLLVGLAVYFVYKHLTKVALFAFSVVNCGFILIYIYYFLQGAVRYFFDEIGKLSTSGHWYISTYFYFFLIIMILFYLTAGLSYAIELNKEFEFIPTKKEI